MEDIKLSVVIPVHKTPVEKLRRALKSTAKLTIAHETIVVFDGAPEVALLDAVNSFGKDVVRYSVIQRIGHAEARNAGIARNVGIREAAGEWIAFLDADDEIIAEGMQDLVLYGDENGCQLVQGKYIKRMNASTEECAMSNRPCIYRGGAVREFLRTIFLADKGTGTVWSKIFRRSYLIDHRIGFGSDLAIEDTPFMFDATRNMLCIGFIPVDCYSYYRNEGSLVTSFRKDYAECIATYLIQFKKRVDKLSDAQVSTAFDQYVVFYLLLVMLHYVFNPQNDWTTQRQHAEFDSLLHFDLYRNALARTNGQDMSLSKRISVYVLKHHMFRVMKVICNIRNMQIRK